MPYQDQEDYCGGNFIQDLWYFPNRNYNFTTPIITIEESDTKRRRTFQTPLPPQDIHDNDPDQWAYWTIPDPNPNEDLNPEFDFDDFLFGEPDLQDYHHVDGNTLPNIIEEWFR